MTASEAKTEEAAPAASSLFVTSYDDLAKAVLSPISDSFEDDIEDHPDFDAVSDELMKRGTLSHGSIDWSLVEREALQLLQNTQKSLAVLEAVLLARMTRKTRGALTSCIRGLDACLTMPRADLCPKEDRRFDLILRRICGLFSMDALPGKPGTEAERLDESLARLTKNELLLEHGLVKDFRVLQERLELEKKQTENEKAQTTSGSSSSGDGAKTGSIGSATPMDARSFKRTAAEICTLIFQEDPSLPFIYQLRRHACWQEITGAPQITSESRTIIPAVSIDTCDKYRDALKQSKADIAVIHQLETTLFSMPFWIEGQYISAQLALKADHIQVANAITESTQGFISRIPELRELCFNDGTPFIEGETAEWLSSKPVHADMPAQADSQQENKGLTDFVGNPRLASKWNGEYKSQRSPRQKAFMELTMLEDLAGSGFSALVSDQTLRLQTSVEETSITDWDPEFFKRAAALTRKSRK
ncbi:TssA family type VI secretion system protein [Pseudovibrio sp. Ad26]|uniref:TssA family type VI secretion system protein n=1 Tax=Pseudovibrio sp. Ad26 TaxID=989410 RepID=UPI0007AE7925|nr:TssA family type VI secretion system protein [Pseudovibrio sp. Ad26]KZL13449.1 hypothetical protein PsAD26_02220 [Pseudovibrio sp. Ad26]